MATQHNLINKKQIGLLIAVVAIFALLLGSQAAASFHGRNGYSGNPAVNGGNDCTSCHVAGAAWPTVTVTGPTTVQAGSIHTFYLKITGGPAVVAGFNLSVDPPIGILQAADQHSQLVEGELSHTTPRPFYDGSVTYAFLWKAPAASQTVVFYAAANSGNGDGNLTGDGINTTQFAVQVIGGSETAAPQPTPRPAAAAVSLNLVPLVTNAEHPVHLTHAGDERLFVVDQAGWVNIMDRNGNVYPDRFLDIFDRVTGVGERGFLSIAFHPDYATNGYFYAAYTTGDDDLKLRISRFSVSDDPNRANRDSETVIIDVPQPYDTHNGGTIAFGNDGNLYIGTGDGGSQADPDNRSQDRQQLLGKMLRIDVDQRSGIAPDCGAGGLYTIPADNMFNDGLGGNCDEVYAMGFRNPWKWSVDRVTGDFWIGDVGQSGWEEINYIAAGSNPAGNNFGWKCYEGDHPFRPEGCADKSAYKAPVYEYANNTACSVTGGYVYRGAAIPALASNYIFSDFCDSKLRVLSGGPYTPSVEFAQVSGGRLANAVAFGEDVHGELYVIGYDIAGETGSIFRIEAGEPPAEPKPDTQPPPNEPNDTRVIEPSAEPLPPAPPNQTTNSDFPKNGILIWRDKLFTLTAQLIAAFSQWGNG